MVKGCSWIMLFYKTAIFIIVGIILFIVAIWLRQTDFIPTNAIATGRYIVDPKNQQFSYEIEYVIEGNSYQKFEMFNNRILSAGDTVQIYVNVKNPNLIFLQKPNKVSNICFLVSFLCFVIFVVSFIVASKYPAFFCSASILSQIF